VLNIAFALALAPSLLAALRGELALALGMSFPAALVLAGMVRLLCAAAEGRPPYFRLLWEDVRLYGVMLTVWGACVVAGLALLTPLLYVAVVPALVFALLAPLVVCVGARLKVGVALAWRNAFVLAVHFPVVALGLVMLGGIVAWGISASGGALIVALPALWAVIAVYTVDELIRTLNEQEKQT
jgi:hypothetical protein